jgi:hypothetical protein
MIPITVRLSAPSYLIRAGFNCLCKVQLDYFYLLMTSNQTLYFDKHQLGTAVDIRLDAYARTSFLLQANDHTEWVDKFLFVVR